jgi:hypothetical protein
MFMQRVTAKMILAATLSVCLLGMFLTCMTVCAKRMEMSPTVDAHVMSDSCVDVECLVKSSLASALPEESFRSPGFDGGVNQRPPGFGAELISGGSERRFCLLPSLDPPFERFRVLRI